jgi:hypothetical protein
MAYLRSLFFQNNGFISHYNISSGDDDLFINRVATKSNTTVVIDPEAFTYSDPKESFGGWFIQKRRHLSTGKYYRFRHKLLLGLYNSSSLLFLGLFAALLILNFHPFVNYAVLGLFVLRMISQMIIFRKSMIRLKEKGLWLITSFLEIILIAINLYLAVIVFFSKPSKWK